MKARTVVGRARYVTPDLIYCWEGERERCEHNKLLMHEETEERRRKKAYFQVWVPETPCLVTIPTNGISQSEPNREMIEFVFQQHLLSFPPMHTFGDSSCKCPPERVPGESYCCGAFSLSLC